jgi:hypothetical protein
VPYKQAAFARSLVSVIVSTNASILLYVMMLYNSTGST